MAIAKRGPSPRCVSYAPAFPPASLLFVPSVLQHATHPFIFIFIKTPRQTLFPLPSPKRGMPRPRVRC